MEELYIYINGTTWQFDTSTRAHMTFTFTYVRVADIARLREMFDGAHGDYRMRSTRSRLMLLHIAGFQHEDTLHWR